MAFYVSIPLVLGVAFLQVTLPQVGPVAGLKPDLLLVLVVMAGMLLGLRKGLVLAFLGGLVLDFYSGMPFGFITLVLLLVTSLARFPSPGLLEVNPMVCMFIVGLATLFYNGILSLGVVALGGETNWMRLATAVVLPITVMNALLSLLVFGILVLLVKKPVPLRESWR